MSIVPFPLKLVNQDDDKSCSAACIAMLLDTSLESIRIMLRRRFGLAPPLTSLQVAKALCCGEVYALPENPISPVLVGGHLYIVSVKSLNITGGMHHVIVDMRCDPPQLLDPQNGRPDRQFYAADMDLNTLEVSEVLRIIDV